MKANQTLTAENAKDGMMIEAKDHPEWGTWQMIAGERWEIRNRSGRKVLDEGEFHFWAIVA